MFPLIHLSAATRNSCTVPLSDDFKEDCDSGHLKDFALCLRNSKTFNSTIVADELNKQYCNSQECDFFCTS